MTLQDIAEQRLYNQRLHGATFTDPHEAVQQLGAVQAQEFSMAKWALGMRTKGTVDANIQQAFDSGSILRVHVMRPTWHFIAAEDIVWMQALTGPRVHAFNAYYYRKAGLTDTLAATCKEILAQALEGGKQLTRTELAAVLTNKGVSSDIPLLLPYILIYAELDGLICSGPMHGKQHTYMLVRDRAPQAKPMPHDEALALLVRRYFTTRGPAQIKDFVWWSGLTVSEAKRGLDLSKHYLQSDKIEGTTYWFAADMQPYRLPGEPVFLLPSYDEFGIAYKDRSAFLQNNFSYLFVTKEGKGFFNTLLFGSQFGGSWRRTVGAKRIVVETLTSKPFTKAQERSLRQALREYEAFCQLPVTLL
ncbi:MAG TPA: winged helix DNA-binding domain-containing protein [Candidatus Saccharimonadales bacterium]|nr:winged helix DNA-binding domain-containing protein [Candidatus Saccharimonadales bacterium]